MINLIGSLVGEHGSETVVTECRRCGTTVDRGAAVCSVCESDDIVRYEIR